MALEYKSSLARYRRYLATAQQQPLWQAGFYVTLSLLLIIVLLVFALRPTLVTIAGLLGNIKTESELEKRMDTKIQAIQSAQQEYQRVGDRLPTLDAALPDDINWSDFADSVYKLATHSAIQLNTISLNPLDLATQKLIILPNGVSAFQFNLTATGSYTDLKSLTNSISSLPRLITWSNLSITKTKDNILTLSATGTISYLPNENKP